MSSGTPGLFGRYALIGLWATAVHYSVLVALVELWLTNPGPAAAAGAGSGALAAYIGNRHLTFASRTAHLRALPRFLFVAAIGALLSGSIVWSGTTLLRLPYLVPQLLATALVLGGGFVLNRQWTFA